VVIGNFHTNPSTAAFLNKFVRIVCHVGKEVKIFSADAPPTMPNVVWVPCRVESGGTGVAKSLSFARSQVALGLRLARARKDFDQAIILATTFAVPLLALKVARKRTTLFVAQKPNRRPALLLCRLSAMLSEVLVVESPSVSREWGIQGKKNLMLGATFVDTQLFSKRTELQARKPTIGYVGGLEKGKGVPQLLAAVRILNAREGGLSYLIAGSGQLADNVTQLAAQYTSVRFKGLVPTSELPGIFNECRLLVLPSVTEGVPNVILEAMACGTPVLATAVGGIPDVITDGLTGFIMPTNDPEIIARNILRVLNDSDLNRISENALRMVRKEFSFESALERYERIIPLMETEDDR